MRPKTVLLHENTPDYPNRPSDTDQSLTLGTTTFAHTKKFVKFIEEKDTPRYPAFYEYKVVG